MTEIAIGTALAGLAGWRVAAMLTQEHGPFRIFAKLRSLFGLPILGRQRPRWFVGDILDCVLCCGLWTSVGLFALGYWVTWIPVAMIAAASVTLAGEAVRK